MQSKEHNPIRLAASVGTIVGATYFVSFIPESVGSILWFAAFLVASAILLSLISIRLYLQHQTKKAAFDLLTLFLLVALVSLPIGIGTHFTKKIAAIPENHIHGEETLVSVFLCVAATFLLIPILVLTERIMFVAARFWTILRRRNAG